MNFANPQEHVPEAETKQSGDQGARSSHISSVAIQTFDSYACQNVGHRVSKETEFLSSKEWSVTLLQSAYDFASTQSWTITDTVNMLWALMCRLMMSLHISNTNAPRSLDCIYLRYNDNAQGGHELLHLPTNSMLTRRTVTPVPITPAIIKQVHTIADQEGMPEGLKIANRTGQIFYDTAWIAGVDYDEEGFDDEFEEEYEDDDEASERNGDDLPDGQFDHSRS